MDVIISAERDGRPDEVELRSLLQWLIRERPRRWRAELARAEQEAGTMGGVADTLQIALGAGGAGALLARAISTWIQTRRAPLKLHIVFRDGTELELDAELKDADALLARLAGIAGDGDE